MLDHGKCTVHTLRSYGRAEFLRRERETSSKPRVFNHFLSSRMRLFKCNRNGLQLIKQIKMQLLQQREERPRALYLCLSLSSCSCSCGPARESLHSAKGTLKSQHWAVTVSIRFIALQILNSISGADTNRHALMKPHGFLFHVFVISQLENRIETQSRQPKSRV